MKHTFLALLTTSLAACAATLTPPLPEGAQRDWNLQNAWKRQSATQTEYCINGLWDFRSAPELNPTQNLKVLYQVKPEDYKRLYRINESQKGVTIKYSLDSREHTTSPASLRLDVDAAPGTNLFQGMFQLKDVPREIPVLLSFDVKANAEGLDFYTELQDNRSWRFFNVRSNNIPTKCDWRTITVPILLPNSTPYLNFLFPRNQSGSLKGTIWIDNIRFLQQTFPSSVQAAVPQDANWGCALVPGGWVQDAPSNVVKNVFWHPQDSGRDKRLPLGWFRRTIDIPADWSGKRVSLRFDRIATSASIYCDQQLAGILPFQGGEVDITRFATPGKTLELAVLVLAQPPQEAQPGYTGKGRPNASHAGIYGDVYLRVSDQTSCQVLRPRIVTTTEDRTLAIHAALSSPAPAGTTWKIDITRDGKPAAQFDGPVPAGATVLDTRSVWNDVVFWDVNSPVLYELRVSLLQDGKLLTQTLPERFGFRDFVIKGKYFYLNGVKINLNPCSYYGQAFNWDCDEAIRHWLKKVKETGYNFVYMEDNEIPGFPMTSKPLLRFCDEMGILAAITVPKIPPLPDDSLDGPASKSWRDVATTLVAEHVNFPSLVLWRMNMNLGGYSQDQNPLLLDGKREFKEDSGQKVVEKRLLWSNAFIRSLDPTRSTYNHACGKTGEIYTLNNYLGWPEQQDLREWLRVWAQNADKPLMMVEHATPYPGDLQMRDPKSWWMNEPLQSEYAAILLGEQAYRMEEPRYVDYIQLAWNPKRRAWNSSYTYYCELFPDVLDECICITYRNMYQAWRTWGISGGMNMWENNMHRPRKLRENGVMPQFPPPVNCKIDWTKTQYPGRLVLQYSRSNKADGQLRCFFDQDTPIDREWFEELKHLAAFKRYMSRTYAYFGGPKERWYTVEHAFRSGERPQKSLVLLNDQRKPVTFQATITLRHGNKTTTLLQQNVTVPPAEVRFLPFAIPVPKVDKESAAELRATLRADDAEVPVEPFALQFFPAKQIFPRASANWVLLDPVGKTRDALARAKYQFPNISKDAPLPNGANVLVIGANALETVAGSPVLQDAAKRLPYGLRILICEQSDEVLSRVFGLRTVTPGARQAWLRDPEHPALWGISDTLLQDWRNATTLGPVATEAPDEGVSQREKRVWRCSQEGVVASTIVEKPHVNVVHPLLDTGFALRYTPLWEIPCGKGVMLFCNLDISDRVGREPAADTILANLVRYLDKRVVNTRAPEVAYLGDKLADPDLSTYSRDLVESPNGVQILVRGCKSKLESRAKRLKQLVQQGGTIVAFGLTQEEAAILQEALGGFTTNKYVNWLNPLEGTLPEAFRGLSIADIRWRIKRETPVVASVEKGWRSPSGVLAEVSIGKGRLVWFSALPQDFDPTERMDLIFTRVQTTRLLNVILQNLGVYQSDTPNYWADRLASNSPAQESDLYNDKRTLHDDPYAEMRW